MKFVLARLLRYYDGYSYEQRYTLIFLYIQLTLQQTISVQEHSSHAIPN
jgi:hypothetical protein